MGEERKTRISEELSIMNLPREDLISMIQLNSQGDVPEAVPYETLINICAHGMTYGSIREVCPTCNSILHTDGKKYRCLGKSFMQSTCNYFRYHVRTSKAPWEIPVNVTKKEKLEMLKKKSKNYQVVSFLDTMQKKQRENVISDIDLHKSYHIIANKKLLRAASGMTYSYFCVINDDFIGNYQKKKGSTGTSSHCYGQIHVIDGNPKRYVFYKLEKVFEKSYDHFYDPCSIDEVVELFTNQFHSITGNTWTTWIEGNFVRTCKSFFPLKLDYCSRLPYLEAQMIDEIHEEFVVTLGCLEKLKINGQKITKLSIQDAQSITVQRVTDAHVILTCFKKFKEEGTEEKLRRATKNQLKFLDDEEGLKFGSIVSRLLTPSVGTTIRLVDLPQKFFLFKPIGKILSVFFNYQKLRQNWRNPHQTWPSSPGKLTQEYMLDMTRGIIGSWIMKLALSPDEQMHHYYVKQKDSGCCYWSVLLRIAGKMFDSSSDRFILCTIDVEELPEDSEHDMKKDETFMDEQTDIGKMCLSNIDERYYDKCGYIHHTENRMSEGVHWVEGKRDAAYSPYGSSMEGET